MGAADGRGDNRPLRLDGLTPENCLSLTFGERQVWVLFREHERNGFPPFVLLVLVGGPHRSAEVAQGFAGALVAACGADGAARLRSAWGPAAPPVAVLGET